MKIIIYLIGFLFFAPQAAFAAPKIVLKALLKNQVMVQVNGKYRSIKVGKPSPEGIKLLSSSSKKAVFEVDGKQFTLDLNRNRAASYRRSNTAGNSSKKNKKDKRVIIRRSGNGHFRIKGQINGKSIQFLVDTGATTIAISAAFAKKIRVDKSKKKKYGYASTAGGRVKVYSIKLARVKIGGIELRGIRAMVLPNLDNDALLGMSFLKRVNMDIKNNVMTLSKKY